MSAFLRNLADTAAFVSEDMAAEEPTAEPPRIQSRWPTYGEDEIAAVVEVLRSGRVNALHHGERCQAFEQAFATLCEMPHALSVSNGTVGLEMALRALGIGSGDEVIVTARSFVASAGCVVACGATPVFADVDPVSQNITAQSIAQVLTPRTRAVIAVHLGGFPCAMDEIVTLAEAADLLVIEDCAQAHGATFRGRPVGSFGDAAVFSFCTDKIMSTGGEGGMILLREHSLWERAWSLSNHGKDYATANLPAGSAFRWVHDGFGSNYRMTEMQAAIGLRQITKLPGWVAARRRNATILNEMLEGLPTLRLVHPSEDFGHAYYAFYAFVREEELAHGWSRDRILQEMRRVGMPCQSGICPEIYREASFRQAGYTPPKRLPNARMLGRTSLKLPVDHTLDADDMRAIGQSLRSIAVAAGG
jgi:dTDP-4-amino-4,6-dideoxygalactose transaminase